VRHISEKEYAHELLGDKFAHGLSMYDTQRRMDILIDEFLPESAVKGKRVLEVGAGYGFFSERLQQRGAIVTATDIGEGLLAQVKERVGCECIQADALSLEESFGRNSFDTVLSSECVEHTPSPGEALRQMAKVLRPGGWLSVSTPNLIWQPVVRLATFAGARPFDGLENFSTFRGMRQALAPESVQVVRQKGLHLFPFQLPLHSLSRWCDRRLQVFRSLMINLCVLGRKTAAFEVKAD